MGTGRNALYLARLGWEVYGFDQSAVAVATAQRRARELGLKIHTAAVADWYDRREIEILRLVATRK